MFPVFTNRGLPERSNIWDLKYTFSRTKYGAPIIPLHEGRGKTLVTNRVWIEKRLRNVYEHKLFYLDYKYPRFTISIRGVQAAAPLPPPS